MPPPSSVLSAFFADCSADSAGRFRARFLVRLDGGFASPELFDFLDEEPKLDYVVAMAKNLNLERSADFWMPAPASFHGKARRPAHVYGSSHYKAKKWSRERRVVIKAEVVRHPGRAPKENPRFIITNLPHSPRWIYEKVYLRPRRHREPHQGASPRP